MHYSIIIIGAGASGLMCALTAGKRGRQVLIIDHAHKVGSKILMSGGGKCNFTNLYVESENFISNNPHFCKSALSRFSQFDFLSMIDENNIVYEEREFGQLFCKKNAKEIVDLLLNECYKNGVKFQLKCTIDNIRKEDNFHINTTQGNFTADSLVIATGGLSIPIIGASGFGYDLARQFGLNVIPQTPGLVSINVDRNVLPNFSELSGISLNASVTCNNHTFKDALLFTHKGLSGPVILQISNYWTVSDEIIINLLPDIHLIEKIAAWQIRNPKAEVKNLISKYLPKKLIQKILERTDFTKPINQYNKNQIEEIAKLVHKWILIPTGTEGYKKAEVTRGGIDTNELSSKNFETRQVKGLYFIGEVLDVTGWLGGYNLQWAWSSGYCAGLVA